MNFINILGYFRGSNQARFGNFLACNGSKQKFTVPRLTLLENILARARKNGLDPALPKNDTLGYYSNGLPCGSQQSTEDERPRVPGQLFDPQKSPL